MAETPCLRADSDGGIFEKLATWFTENLSPGKVPEVTGYYVPAGGGLVTYYDETDDCS